MEFMEFSQNTYVFSYYYIATYKFNAKDGDFTNFYYFYIY